MAQETEQLQKTADGFYDLTGIESPRFRFQFTIRQPDGTQRIEQRDIDAEWIAMQLATALPTLFRPFGEPGPDGRVRFGVEVVVEAFMAGGELPPSLPPITSMIATMKRIFGLPEDVGAKGTMLLFAAFAHDMVMRMQKKKITPDSPGSPAPTPGA